MTPRRSVPSAAGGIGLARRVRRWLASELGGLRAAIETSAAACHAEHSRKHVTSLQHLCLLLFHGLAAQRSPRQSYEQFAACVGPVAVSGLAAADGTRPAAVAAGVHLVTHLYPKTTVTVEEDRPIQPPLPDVDGGRIAVVADQWVTLGSPNNHTSAVLPGLRLVTADVLPRLKTGHRAPTPRRYQIVTDRWDRTAAEVVQVYLWRWQLELFRRWLKSHIRLPRLLGSSENAVELSVWLAILVHLLTLLAARALGFTLPLLTPT